MCAFLNKWSIALDHPRLYGRLMNRTFRALLAAAVIAAAGLSGGSAAVAKSCSAGYTHAVISGEHKCLRAGQFCAKAADRTYHRYGFHCHTGRLTH